MTDTKLNQVITDLRKSLSWLDLVLSTLHEGVITLEEDMRIHFANDAFAKMIDVERIFLLGSPIWKALPLVRNGKPILKTDYIRALKQKKIDSLNGVYTLQLAHSQLELEITFAYIDKIKQTVLVIRDITKQKQDEKALAQESAYVRLHQDIAVAANESESISEAMKTCLRLICTEIGWPVGHVYYVNRNDELVPSDIWFLKTSRNFRSFRKVTESRNFKRGEGLPGIVLASGEPTWIVDVNKDPHFTRRKQAKEGGIKSGIAFTVVTNKEVVAVLEFYSNEIIQPNKALLDVMQHIGTQLGRVIERRIADEKIKLIKEQAARVEAEAAKQQIQLSEIRYRTMIEQSPLSTQILSPHGETLKVNKAWEKLWGVTLTQIKGYNMLEDKQLETLGIMKYIKKGFNGQATIIPAIEYDTQKSIKNISNVPKRWVRAFIYPVKDEKGKIQEVVLIHDDITDQIQSEERLKQSEERFRTLIEQSTDAIQLVSPEGRILYSSESIKNVLGYSVEELQGSDVSPFVHPDDKEYFFSQIQTLLKKPHKQISLQYRVKHKDGSWAWLETTGVNHLKTPHINALVGTFRNITDRKKKEEELRYQKSLLEAQREVSPEGVLIVSPEGKMVSYNKRFVQMWKFSKKLMASGQDELALQEGTQQLVDPDGFIKRVLEVYKNRQATYEELHFTDGRVFDRYGSPITGDDGTDFGYVWFFQDITSRKRLEKQKDEFISIASHELKTPVTSIKSFAQVLELKFKKDGNIKAAEMLGKMDAQINKLTNLIGDLLDVTKLETGKVQFHNTHFVFDDLISELVEEMQRTTEKHTLIIASTANKRIFADRERVGQVLTNLISNAIKYSPHTDKIVIHTRYANGKITLCVEDFGVGISSEKQDKVFERFFRVSGPGKDTFPGLGLGLYISAEIIKRQNGKIWVESKLGHGSTFCFTLPLKPLKKNGKRNNLAEEEIKHD